MPLIAQYPIINLLFIILIQIYNIQNIQIYKYNYIFIRLEDDIFCFYL